MGDLGRVGPPVAVVFDLDGTLVDTTAVWTAAYLDVLGERATELGPADRTALLGASVTSAGRYLRRRLALDAAAQPLEQALADRLGAHLTTAARALPDARALLARLGTRRRLAVASNAPRWFVLRALTAAGLADRFAAVLGEEDAVRPKPAPDLYLRACEALEAAPGRALAVEDSPAGVAAARAAGLHVICRPVVPVGPVAAHRVVASLEDAAVMADLGLAGE
jgi:HAD superfamily hydrolase (TIGR01509 family)